MPQVRDLRRISALSMRFPALRVAPLARFASAAVFRPAESASDKVVLACRRQPRRQRLCLFDEATVSLTYGRERRMDVASLTTACKADRYVAPG